MRMKRYRLGYRHTLMTRLFLQTRLMNQAGGHKTEGGRAYSSVLNCFARMVHEEGVGSLYKGFAPLATRKVVWTVGYFFVYEQALLSMRGSYS